MSTAASTPRPALDSVAERSLKAAAAFWFGMAVIGQWAFLLYLVAFYGPSTFSGDFQSWTRNTFPLKSYVAGDSAGNLAFATHALLAAVISLGGTIQLVPQIRKRAIAVHRWIGRLFLPTAFVLAVSGLYMIWVRNRSGASLGGVAVTLNAVLIIAFGGLAWRAARARDIAAHRRWALRTFLVANAQWFIRIGVFAWIIVNRGPVGIGSNFDGPVIRFASFGCYLVPLAVLELYLGAKRSRGPRRRLGMAGALVLLTLFMGTGIFGVAMAQWLPSVKAAHDPRRSIADTLAVTIASRGIDGAVRQYGELKRDAPTSYFFMERELNRLGRELLAAHKNVDAIRIFQLNVEAYPRSSGVYASLAEAYLQDGNRPEARANCQKALRLNPKNGRALAMLERLTSEVSAINR
jgi:hypothetical protein